MRFHHRGIAAFINHPLGDPKEVSLQTACKRLVEMVTEYPTGALIIDGHVEMLDKLRPGGHHVNFPYLCIVRGGLSPRHDYLFAANTNLLYLAGGQDLAQQLTEIELPQDPDVTTYCKKSVPTVLHAEIKSPRAKHPSSSFTIANTYNSPIYYWKF